MPRLGPRALVKPTLVSRGIGNHPLYTRTGRLMGVVKVLQCNDAADSGRSDRLGSDTMGFFR